MDIFQKIINIILTPTGGGQFPDLITRITPTGGGQFPDLF